jgi:hypothetical protein
MRALISEYEDGGLAELLILSSGDANSEIRVLQRALPDAVRRA